MPLKTDLKQYFSTVTRQKGEALYRSGSIRIGSGSISKVAGKSVGTSTYHIDLSSANKEILGCCDCPEYDDLGACKHIWGMMLKADEKGYLTETHATYISILDDDDEDEDDEFMDDFDEGEDEYPNEDRLSWARSPRGKKPPPVTKTTPGQRIVPPPPPAWKKLISSVQEAARHVTAPVESWRDDREIYYVIDGGQQTWGTVFCLNIQVREKLQSGAWGKLKDHSISRGQVSLIPDPLDRELVGLLGGKVEYSYGVYSDRIPSAILMPPPLVEILMPKVCASGKCLLRANKDQPFEAMPVMGWDPLPPFGLAMKMDDMGEEYVLSGGFRRGDDFLELTSPTALFQSGFFLANNQISRFNTEDCVVWLTALRREGKVSITKKDGPQFRAEILKGGIVPATQWPPELAYEEISPKPQSCVRFAPVETFGYSSRKATSLEGRLSFNYGDATTAFGERGTGAFVEDKNIFIRRDPTVEQEAAARLDNLSLKRITDYYSDWDVKWEVPAKRLPAIVRDLLGEGWHVEAEGKTFRQASSFNAELTSGVDWFELRGAIDFGDSIVDLPQLIKALQKGENLVQLSDGSYGMVPEDFLAKYGTLLQLGKASGDHIQFKKSQTGLLDVFLAEREGEIKVDEIFRQARERVRSFTGIAPLAQPPGFQGELRGYQCEGLGWMRFLEESGWGGCLADDMGIGKTAQVLAMLESRRELKRGPSLAVVPRSLIYNWMREAAKFTPGLRVLDNSGGGRTRDAQSLQDHDLVLTTYGALRRDVLNLKDHVFDYVILDEAQMIKNATSESAKAARLLKANHRLALSGTPIENHLGELWSLFEFLNPGMMGGSTGALAGSALRNPAPETRQLLARAVRPFILRRTKEQVVKELPSKSEQTIYCELDGEQRKTYDELLTYYRHSLLGKIDAEGMGKSKIMILEALLRLRQAACHPGLIDKERIGESSAKLETLLPRLEEVLSEGHKALVFSQFTSLLSIVKTQLDKKKVTYEYLDGKTKDREACVDRFQNDPDCKLFLISLKAGGLGLNLTAADYVFLLDPWWNPAAESQAIDRTHRIGQQRPVFAYRLIAKGTVEERVLELQKSKRELADSIISEDNRFVGNLKREDLELLFS